MAEPRRRRRRAAPSAVGLLVSALLPGLTAGAGLRRGAARALQPDGDAPVGPSPYLIWVERGSVPTTTTPAPEQCYGCGCLIPFADSFVQHGLISGRYFCGASASGAVPMPELRWSPPTRGPQCVSCQTFALTVADLDFPDGVGSPQNEVHHLFWAANIPHDWTEFSQEKVREAERDGGATPVVGRNRRGAVGMEPICPERGRHRYRITLWVLKESLSGIESDTPYHEVMALLESTQLARATIFAEAVGRPSAPGGGSLLQHGPDA